MRAESAHWSHPSQARALGYSVQLPVRTAANRNDVLVFHAEHSASRTSGRSFDPSRPKALVFAQYPGGRLRLLGAMYGMKRGLRGATPGGPITRWHTHPTCRSGAKRGIEPLANGTCPAGMKLAQGNEMMHIWLTRDLRSAFSLHAPRKELCALHMLRGSPWCTTA